MQNLAIREKAKRNPSSRDVPKEGKREGHENLRKKRINEENEKDKERNNAE